MSDVAQSRTISTEIVSAWFKVDIKEMVKSVVAVSVCLTVGLLHRRGSKSDDSEFIVKVSNL